MPAADSGKYVEKERMQTALQYIRPIIILVDHVVASGFLIGGYQSCDLVNALWLVGVHKEIRAAIR